MPLKGSCLYFALSSQPFQHYFMRLYLCIVRDDMYLSRSTQHGLFTLRNSQELPLIPTAWSLGLTNDSISSNATLLMIKKILIRHHLNDLKPQKIGSLDVADQDAHAKSCPRSLCGRYLSFAVLVPVVPQRRSTLVARTAK